jgi:hypothetical protein
LKAAYRGGCQACQNLPTIDASEWIGPWQNMAIGLHKAAGYYYYPGFQEPGTAQTLGINKRVTWRSPSVSAFTCWRAETGLVGWARKIRTAESVLHLCL